MPRDIPALVARAVEGDRGSVAKLISIVESGGADAAAAGAALYPHTGNAYTVGLTGAPGAGKSSLTDALIGRIRRDDVEVGVLAIDPTSPFSGGAILGDRVRMQDHATDPGVYIRSMATRGHLGGLALATPRAARVPGAAGQPWRPAGHACSTPRGSRGSSWRPGASARWRSPSPAPPTPPSWSSTPDGATACR